MPLIMHLMTKHIYWIPWKKLNASGQNELIFGGEPLSKVTEPICRKFSTKVGLMKSLSNTLSSSAGRNIGVPNVIHIIWNRGNICIGGELYDEDSWCHKYYNIIPLPDITHFFHQRILCQEIFLPKARKFMSKFASRQNSVNLRFK